jgi:hypothetical protein
MKHAILGLVAAVMAVAADRVQAEEPLRDLCPDRPGKNTSACTVDAGYVQVESDLFDGTFQRAGGVTTDTYLVTDTLLKYGVTDDFDIEANIAPYEIIRVHDSNLGTTTTAKGIGDLFLRAKFAATGNGGSAFALVLEPFLKVPTAPHSIGNGAVEGGLLVPLALSLPDGWQLESTPEIDVLKNNVNGGRHVGLTDVVAVSRGVGGGVTLGVEFWEATDFDPGQTTQQYSFDLDAAWIPEGMPNLQLDTGVNLGLNRETPGSQVYAGISERL